ncbi:MAG: hypothetical protein HY700_10295 [Gemmatimonadetes bacterium]|nr:hypothetical protein [Gemmatimonadota bacterium]
MVQRPHRKVRFLKVELKVQPKGRCRAFVDLVKDTGDVFVGSAEGRDSTRLDIVAFATGDAIVQTVGGTEETLVVRGAVMLPTFGTKVVVAGASVFYENQKAFVQGICMVNDDPHRAAALAILNATNRFFGIG